MHKPTDGQDKWRELATMWPKILSIIFGALAVPYFAIGIFLVLLSSLFVEDITVLQILKTLFLWPLMFFGVDVGD